MDDGSARAVRVAFERLYRDGLAYRTEALVNWCPGCRTSVSDLEVDLDARDRDALVGPLSPHRRGDRRADPDETITVATTRPETILGDTAVAVHPDDERYAALVGRRVRIPFVERDVPIIADEVVDPASAPAPSRSRRPTTTTTTRPACATACRRRPILADDATIANTGTALRRPGPLRGPRSGSSPTSRRAATSSASGPRDGHRPLPAQRRRRRAAAQDPVVHPDAGRWPQRALEATRGGRTRILPERFEKTWEHWLTNIRDWNVIRQLWWGHRIPAWYCPDGHVTVSSDDGGPGACDVCGRPAAELQQDPDIFDTWFSSGLWPFSTLGWPDDTPDLPALLPDVGHGDRLRHHLLLGRPDDDARPPPDRRASRSTRSICRGSIRDPDGQKMSKTKGNVVDPLGVIDETGADALRFALIHGDGARAGPAVRAGQARERAQLRQQALERDPVRRRGTTGDDPAAMPSGGCPTAADLGPAERWLLSRARGDGRGGRCGDGRLRLRRGDAPPLRGDLERVLRLGPRAGQGPARRRVAAGRRVREATWWALVEALDTYLRLLHPVMPFVTEALWGAIPHRASDPDLLIVARWPAPAERDVAVERRGRGGRSSSSPASAMPEPTARIEAGRLAAGGSSCR